MQTSPEQQAADEWQQELALLLAKSIARDLPPLTEPEWDRVQWLWQILSPRPNTPEELHAAIYGP